MSLGTIYTRIAAGEATRTRALLPECLIKHFKINVKVSDPDEVFPAKFPMKLVPAFQFPDGTLLSESLPINLFLLQQVENHGGLLGDNSQKAWAQNLQWMEFFNNDFMRPSGLVFSMIVGRKPFNQDVFNFFMNQLRNVVVPVIEKHLGESEYLTGSAVSIADLYAATMFLRPLRYFMDEEWRSQLPRTMEWWEKVSKHPVFDNFFADLQMVDKFTPPN